MKTIIVIFALLVGLQDAQAQGKSWETYYEQFTPEDEELTVRFKNGQQKEWCDLTKYEKRKVKAILREEYDVSPRRAERSVSRTGDMADSVGRGVANTAMYIVTAKAVTKVLSVILK